jgi:putative membrane-bound dehydrogenase-like protein
LKRYDDRPVKGSLGMTGKVLIAALLAALWPGGGSVTHAQGYPPHEAVSHMTVAPGFEVSMFAAEPEVRQCILVQFDDRGRLWTIQYLQYPNPAGLKRVQVDRYSRTVYDRIPEPPPKGPKGADRLTILEDTDGDGRADRFHDFISDLNLATGLAFGYGGVFVMQAPYLLFYPDRDRDDKPDGHPEVLLSGFGMEDAQAMANHLTWGPDGWLYGLNGSTTTCKIRGIEFQQGVWRYHPVTRQFELFCEGGGNVYGLTFDADGQLFYSSNGTRPAWHAVQGAYYHKQFSKHGELHNPYAFGYFQFVPHENYRGGHVTCGGTFYYGDSFPSSFRGKYLCTNLLAHEIQWHSFFPLRSTFRSRREGELVVTNDTWVAPVDLTVGPDGAAYVADFYDKRTAHPDPDADWDRTNGRIYRIQEKGAKRAPHVDLNTLTSDQLVDRLGETNDWYVRLARRILAQRRDRSVIPRLRRLALEAPHSHLALEALWALYVSGGFDDQVAIHLLSHGSPAVRQWTIRFLGDQRDVSDTIQRHLIELARSESSPVVRCQMAASARRLPVNRSLPLAWVMAHRTADAEDPFIPLLLWWAVESKAGADRTRVLETFAAPAGWKLPLVRDTILTRLMRRYAMEASTDSLSACARLLATAPNEADRQLMLVNLDLGLGGRRLRSFPEDLRIALAKLGQPETTTNVRLLRVALACGNAAAHERLLELATQPRLANADRVACLEVLGQMGEASCVPRLLPLLALEEQHDVEIAALRALAHFDDPRIPVKVLAEYPRYSEKLKTICRQVLLSRKAWVAAFLGQVGPGPFDPKKVSVEELRGLEVFADDKINALVAKHWGRITRGTPEEKLADIRRFNNDLRAAPGGARAGYAVFKEHCAKCHKLFDEGENIGPDLTTANRKDQGYLLTSMVDPSSYIRVEYLSVQVITTDGRVFTGIITENAPDSITLVDSKAEKIRLARSSIDELVPSQISQMPEDQLKTLTPQQLRDLFAYLKSDGPVKKK